MPEICLRYTWMSEVYLRYVWHMPEIYHRYDWDISYIYLRYPWDMSEICLRYAWDMPMICLSYVCDMSEICLRYISKICWRDMFHSWIYRDNFHLLWPNLLVSDRPGSRDAYASKKKYKEIIMTPLPSISPVYPFPFQPPQDALLSMYIK